MKGVTRVNVVFLAFNVVVAAVLGVALWRFVASDNPAAVRAPGGTNSAPNAAPHAGTVRKPGVEYGFTPQGGGNAATPAGATTGTAPPSSSNDGGSGRDWSLRSLAASPPGASGRTSEIVPAVPASQRAVPPGTAPSIPSKSDVRAGTVVNGSGVPAVPGAPAGAQPPASHTGPTDPTPPPPVDPTSDRTPPVLDALSFNPPQIADGAATTLLVTVHDDLSGVKRVTGNLRSPSGTAIVSFEGQGDNAGTVFGTSIAIPKQAETGNWFVTNLFITDRADNTMVATYTAATTPAGGTLRVMSSQSDNTAPEVRGTSVDKVAVKDGESDVIRVDVQDDVSGVATVTGVFQSPTKTAFIPFTCRPGADGSTWDGPFTVPGNASCGEWTIQQIRVADKAGNIATVPGTAPQLTHSGFLVTTEGDCDATAPTLDAFSLSPLTVSNRAATEITILAQVHDDGTGTTSVTGWAAGPVSSSGQTPQISFTCTRRATDPQDVWTGRFTVPQYAAAGTWRIGRIRVQDKALNTRDYTSNDPVLASATFEVQ